MRLGFIGLGWIGKKRLQSVMQTYHSEISSLTLYDSNSLLMSELEKSYPQVKLCENENDFFNSQLDAVVIATPSAFHFEHAMKALKGGKHCFCQKPLGRNWVETKIVVDTAKEVHKYLAVDLSYRFTQAILAMKSAYEERRIGHIYSAQLIFHNAYGPDKSWYYDYNLSGGGCLIDLGIHLVDLLLWFCDDLQLKSFQSSLYSQGKLILEKNSHHHIVEDYIQSMLQFSQNHSLISVSLTCSWNLSLGKDCEIEVSFFGNEGTLRFYNINGSFYDFQSEICLGNKREILVSPPDNWQGKAILAWFKKIMNGDWNHSESESSINVAAILDRITYKKNSMGGENL